MPDDAQVVGVSQPNMMRDVGDSQISSTAVGRAAAANEVIHNDNHLRVHVHQIQIEQTDDPMVPKSQPHKIISTRDLQGCWFGCAYICFPFCGTLAAVRGDDDKFKRPCQCVVCFPHCRDETFVRDEGTNRFRLYSVSGFYQHERHPEWESFRSSSCMVCQPASKDGRWALSGAMKCFSLLD